MDKFRLYEINSDDFEKLVTLICQRVLGLGTINFTKGPDGGRDGFFNGTANNFPSEKSPWNGKFVIQAKHTENPIAKCSDSDFITTIKKEIEKINKLKKENEIDYYLLFTNRKLAGDKEKELRTSILQTKINDTSIIAIDSISSYLNQYPDISRMCKLNVIQHPFDVKAEELKEIIIKFYEHRGTIIPDKATAYNFSHPGLKKKNTINNLSKDYYAYIEQDSVSYFKDIDDFLKNPRNLEITEFYYNISDELNSKLANLRKIYNCFDDIFVFIYDHIIEKYPELKSKKRLINVFLHYMYFNCDFGLGA